MGTRVTPQDFVQVEVFKGIAAYFPGGSRFQELGFRFRVEGFGASWFRLPVPGLALALFENPSTH